MDEQKPKLSAKFNALGYFSMICVAGSPGCLLAAADQTVRHLSGSPAYFSAGETAFLGIAGAALLTVGAKSMLRVCKEEERLGIYNPLDDEPDAPHGPS